MGSFRIPKDVARPFAWGTEYEGGFDDATWDRRYENRRTGTHMTFREFMARANAGLVEAIWLINGHGKTPASTMDLSGYHAEHKTWAPDRKIDRLNYTTERGREEIRHVTKAASLPHVNLANMQKASRGKLSHPLPGLIRVQDALNDRYHLAISHDGTWKTDTTDAYKHHQKTIGNSDDFADGVPGPLDLADLGEGRFVVVG